MTRLQTSWSVSNMLLPAMVEIPKVTPIESSICVPWRTGERLRWDIHPHLVLLQEQPDRRQCESLMKAYTFHFTKSLFYFQANNSSKISLHHCVNISTYCCDHDGVIKETKSNKGDGVVEQNCKQRKWINITGRINT